MARECIQSNDYDYKVEIVDLMTPEGKKSGVKCARRLDNGTVLGTMSEHYGKVDNAELVDKAEGAFVQAGLKYTKRRCVVTNGLMKNSLGARFRMIYDFENENVALRREDKQKGDVLGMRLILQNSFDRSLRLSFALGLVRLVCTNGMQTLERELDLTRKHSTKLDIDSLLTTDAVTSAMECFKNSTDVFGNLSRAGIEHDQGLNILGNLAKKNVFSEKTRAGIAQIWNNPTHEEDRQRNLYNLYNATTQFLTNDVAESRFELSDKVGSGVLKNLSLASNNPSRLTKLVAALPVEGVQVENN
tara:strand:+ start:803 stop:1708 length:906 start_codon:yes stop_codon:yes gene_type:complete